MNRGLTLSRSVVLLMSAPCSIKYFTTVNTESRKRSGFVNTVLSNWHSNSHEALSRYPICSVDICTHSNGAAEQVHVPAAAALIKSSFCDA